MNCNPAREMWYFSALCFLLSKKKMVCGSAAEKLLVSTWEIFTIMLPFQTGGKRDVQFL